MVNLQADIKCPDNNGDIAFRAYWGVWLLWLLEYNLSVAGAVGFIALSGVAAEFGVIMVLYLNHALDKYHRLEPEGEIRC